MYFGELKLGFQPMINYCGCFQFCPNKLKGKGNDSAVKEYLANKLSDTVREAETLRERLNGTEEENLQLQSQKPKSVMNLSKNQFRNP